MITNILNKCTGKYIIIGFLEQIIQDLISGIKLAVINKRI
jgi:hypothetical protein